MTTGKNLLHLHNPQIWHVLKWCLEIFYAITTLGCKNIFGIVNLYTHNLIPWLYKVLLKFCMDIFPLQISTNQIFHLCSFGWIMATVPQKILIQKERIKLAVTGATSILPNYSMLWIHAQEFSAHITNLVNQFIDELLCAHISTLKFTNQISHLCSCGRRQ